MYILSYKSGPSNLLLDKMKSTEAFNIRLFVTKSNESSPQRRSLITEVSQEGNLSLVNLETLFRRNDLSLIKLGQWSEK